MKASYFQEKKPQNAGIEPVELGPKKALPFTNGAQMTAAVLALALHKGYILSIAADVTQA